ncbi:uncharacterized protein LOC111734195 isoform X2 [Pteropus vampyrus]|uniref:Uncharacterized protein LOC111734195 isoform X2 n=1 Tax=Pteropus vampyrus TaxID=132908 RepID=A0A6P6C462_PTEVA|nr:uncharacterized protein LOC111734195 isoform X2 [Pteropus vampyrus]
MAAVLSFQGAVYGGGRPRSAAAMILCAGKRGPRRERGEMQTARKRALGKGAPGTPDFSPLMLQRATSAQTRSVCPVGSENQQQSEWSSDFGTSYTKLALQPGVTTVIDSFYICPTNKRKKNA